MISDVDVEPIISSYNKITESMPLLQMTKIKGNRHRGKGRGNWS